MKALVVTPAPKGSLVGNRATAQRYARILRDLGVRAKVVEDFEDDACDLVVALHAKKSARAILDASRIRPRVPRIVVLTGTDLYVDGLDAPEVRRSLDLATRIVTLQPAALARLPEAWRAKAVAILQSAERAEGDAKPLDGVFEVVAAAHLRGVKDPFLAAAAVRALPPESRLRVSHVGTALEPGMEALARRESARNPRWRWLGERSHAATLHVLARAEGFVQTSLSEGGSLALAEAVVAGKPVIVSRNEGSIGMLGADHPGLFDPGDDAALAELLRRLETDDEFRAALAARSRELAPRFARELEVDAWRALLADVGLAEGRPRWSIRRAGRMDTAGEFAEAVRAGLTAAPKSLPCRYFYDDAGSRLFEEICALPEYYLTRAEDEILALRAGELVQRMPPGSEVVELGSGTSIKTRRVLAALIERDGRALYRPIDVSLAALEEGARSLTRALPALRVEAVAAEYRAGLRALPGVGRPPRLYLWLGSNVGNYGREEAAEFLRELGAYVDLLDRVVVGFDRRKDPSVLVAAYDDAAGVTARFNRNLLARVAAEFRADVDPESFRHVARYDETAGRIEMFLESTRAQRVRIPALELEVELAAGERIHTEDSYKYSDAEIAALAQVADFRVEDLWTDPAERFRLAVFAPLLPGEATQPA